MGRPGKSRFQRQERARARLRSEQLFGSAPHSFVFARGRAGRSLRGLSRDLRRVMEPYTARSLQVRRSNSLRDLVAVAGPLGVSQFLVLSKSQFGINLKIFRLPGGPTLTFKVLQYSLVRDVVSALRRHRMHEQQFRHPPLLILGNFGEPQMQVKLMAGMFQGMFPKINVHKVNLNSIRRCLLVSYDSDSQHLQLRHYIQVVPVGLSRGLRKILREKFPNLSRMEDVSQLLTGEALLSESEAEPDGPQNVLELPQNCSGRGNAATQQSAVRLTEIGPRLTLQLVKVEEGLGQGNVLYHGLAPKGEEELRELLARKEQRLQVKAERRRKQEQDLERKRQQRLRHRERSLAGMGRAAGGPGDPSGDSDVEDPGAPEAGEAEPSDEDDAEYYREELGEEPDTDLFPSSSKRKRSPSGAPGARKRRKKNPNSQHGTPKSQPGTPKFQPGTPKSKQRTPNSRPGTPNSKPGTPKFKHRAPKFEQRIPKSQPGTPKSHPGPPNSQPGTPKPQPGTPKFKQRTPKSRPGTPNSKPGTPKFKQRTPKSQPGTEKSHPGTPKSKHRTQKVKSKTPNSHPGISKSKSRTPKSKFRTPKS
ncbi:suppressor of SWI4 1 homolog isoform X2 [Oenanthe melanoleuca]|uniref:suppressor of SWI4 1 homolog isoform X2 n=1 Tax=Oenanthe melanoleuca TaxID=2939378 RepID=UPI0024C1F2F0|nr:suppressor of SWI4 1 homolog isoform X2 [Oenanthe melanoleuca]